MKKRIVMFLLPGLSCLVSMTACRNGQEAAEETVRAVVPITISNARTGTMSEFTELPAISTFLVKAVIKSPVTGYVEKCINSPGDHSNKGQLLFELRTREAAALQQDSVHSLGITGLINVKSSIDGVVSVIDHPKGDFVQEGESLCTLVLPESLVFLLELPFEMKDYIHTGNECILLLPGGQQVKAIVRSVLPAMSPASQTQKVILKPEITVSLPENLIAKVRIVRSLKKKAVILPKSSVLSDEIMKNFWVMKLLNDTMAVKVPVVTGISGTDSIEIISPLFLPSERFLTSGNYGLGDTAIVRIIK